MSDELEELEGVISAQHRGAQVFWITAPQMPELVERLAMVLGEHMTDAHELHVTYNAMQAGWEKHEPQPGGVLRAAKPGWTDLHFEYSAFVVLRSAEAPVNEEELWEE